MASKYLCSNCLSWAAPVDPTLDAYANLAYRILHKAVLDARQPSVKPRWKVDARLFLMSDAAEWMAGGVGLDVEALREKALAQWVKN